MILDWNTKQLIQLALAEDVGRGDCTTEYVVSPDTKAIGTIFIKEASRVAGLPVVNYAFHSVDPNVETEFLVSDGADVENGTAVCRVIGTAVHILTVERTALNFLARLSGIATQTREAVKLLEGTSTKLLDTRKTTPGWRNLEKYAVAIGGGHNHRHALDDMVLIKDNHIVAAGSIVNAIRLAQTHATLAQKIEVEVDTLEQLEMALRYGVDMILLDNMNLETLREAVRKTNGQVPLEASGNMTFKRLPEVARTGVQYISMGGLTHSAISVDVGLDLELEPF